MPDLEGWDADAKPDIVPFFSAVEKVKAKFQIEKRIC